MLEVAKTEEKIIEQNLKDLKRNRPLLYQETQDPANSESESEKEVKKESSESEDSEDVDINKPLAINKPVDRLGLKTQTQRNKDALTRAKHQKLKEEIEKKKFEKDL